MSSSHTIQWNSKYTAKSFLATVCGVYFFSCPVYFYDVSSNKKHENLVSQTTNIFASIYLEDPSSSWCFFAWKIGVWLEFAEGATKKTQIQVNKFLKNEQFPIVNRTTHLEIVHFFLIQSGLMDKSWIVGGLFWCGCWRSSTQISLGNGWVTFGVFFCEFRRYFVLRV